jgi:hypothetical protein
MHTQDTTQPPPAQSPARPCGSAAAFKAWIEAWFTTCLAYWRAAAAYEELYRLSTSELEHRGLKRATLARDVTGFDITEHADC